MEEIKKSQKNEYRYSSIMLGMILFCILSIGFLEGDIACLWVTIPFIIGLFFNKYCYKNQVGRYSPSEHIKFRKIK